MLRKSYSTQFIEAGCDEAGRGCLAGPVFAAAVILHESFENELLNDSKKLTVKQRNQLRPIIEENALAWAVEQIDNTIIDEINILNASIMAMHQAIKKLKIRPELLLIDGNRFKKYNDIPHHCIIRGDGLYRPIAAASVLAKTHRDEFMTKLHHEYPEYEWRKNKGYPTRKHKDAILSIGICEYHRKSFRINEQLKFDF